MSGHSKWHSIRHKKGAADKKRGKIFTHHAKLITIAAQEGGGDPDMNPRLRTMIDNAKSAGVPNANIDRAIKKGTGELAGDKMEEITYEGYGPGGVAILIKTITDNKNRTVQDIRTTLSKNGGNMADSGSVSYLFDTKGIILVKNQNGKEEDLEMAAIEAGAEDISAEEEFTEIVTAQSDLASVKENLLQAGFELEKAELSEIPQTTISITGNEDKVQALLEALEDLDDIDEVFCNAEF